MKKFLFSITFVIATFFICMYDTDKIKAYSIQIDVDENWIDNIYNKDPYTSMLQEFLDYWDDHFQNYKYVAFISGKDSYRVWVYYVQTDSIGNGITNTVTPNGSNSAYFVNTVTKGIPNFNKGFYIDLNDNYNYGIKERLAKLKKISSPNDLGYMSATNTNAIGLGMFVITNINEDFISSKYYAGHYSLLRTNIHFLNILNEPQMDGNNYTNFDFIYHGQKINVGDEIPMSMPRVYKLTLKKSFNSGTNAPNMKKVSVTFNESSIHDGKANFKLQYGSNDWNPQNTPILSRYKLYGKRLLTSTEWEEIDSELIYVSNIKEVTEQDGNETIYSFTLNTPSNLCVYEEFMIEFYFDNTQNFYLYCFDNLVTSEWRDTPNFLENYIYYSFPRNYRYAFISSNQETNEGRIYVVYNATINNEVQLQLYNFNYENKSLIRSYIPYPFSDDDYYSYYDFKFVYDKKECLLLTRKVSKTEDTYFYVPIGYNVSFTNNQDNDYSINTPDGFIDGNTDDFNDINNGNSFISIIDNSFRAFIPRIKEMLRCMTLFFDNLDLKIQQMYFVAFLFIICLIVYKFIL